MRRTLWFSSILATIALAIGLSWWAVPLWKDHLALQAIVDLDPIRRAEGWQRLSAVLPSESSSAARLLDRISRQLALAPDEALLDGADRLQALGLWGFDRQPVNLMLRELTIRAGRPDLVEASSAAQSLQHCPLSIELPPLRPVLAALLDRDEPEVRLAALRAALRWAGPEQAADLARIPVREDDLPSRRRLVLALAVSDDPLAGVGAIERVSNGSSPPTELLEAQLLLQILAHPGDLGPLLDVPSERLRSVALPAILRYATDPRAAALLREEAQTGDPAARVALQILDPKLDQEQSRFVATDPREPPWRRRLAAWRWDEIPSGTVEAILALPPADPDGMVYAAVLLAERHLSRSRASELADSWIRSFDDDQKRAGALLAAVLGEHADLLAEAYEAEDIGAVRTTQRLALHALGRPVPGDDPIEFAYRALAAPSGDFKPDVLMALLIAGHAPATERLAAAPPADPELYGDSIRQRIWLIERFVPVWYRRLGRPIGADLPSIRLYLDALWALGELSQRRLTFDAVTRTYSLAPTAAAGTPPR